MLNWFRNLIGSVARGLRWCVVTGVSTVEALGGALLVGMWRGLFAVTAPVGGQRAPVTESVVRAETRDCDGCGRGTREANNHSPIRPTRDRPGRERRHHGSWRLRVHDRGHPWDDRPSLDRRRASDDTPTPKTAIAGERPHRSHPATHDGARGRMHRGVVGSDLDSRAGPRARSGRPGRGDTI